MPGVPWQWWLAGYAALLYGLRGPLQSGVPRVCWSAEAAEGMQLVVLFSGSSQPEFNWGPVPAEKLLLVQLVLFGTLGSEGPGGNARGSQLSLMEGCWMEPEARRGQSS